MNRRSFLFGAGLAIAAPAIIRTPGLLMPIKPLLDFNRDTIGGMPLTWLAEGGEITLHGRWPIANRGETILVDGHPYRVLSANPDGSIVIAGWSGQSNWIGDPS